MGLGEKNEIKLYSVVTTRGEGKRRNIIGKLRLASPLAQCLRFPPKIIEKKSILKLKKKEKEVEKLFKNIIENYTIFQIKPL